MISGFSFVYNSEIELITTTSIAPERIRLSAISIAASSLGCDIIKFSKSTSKIYHLINLSILDKSAIVCTLARSQASIKIDCKPFTAGCWQFKTSNGLISSPIKN